METRNARLAAYFEQLFIVGARVLSGAREVPDSEDFRARVRDALRKAQQLAVQNAYSPEDVRLASFAVVVLLDQALLASSGAHAFPAARPLQEELYGGHVAGEAFFTELERIVSKPDSEALGDLLEVYYLSLLLGYKGRYSMSAPGVLEEVHSAVRTRLLRIREAPSLGQPAVSPIDWPSLGQSSRWWKRISPSEDSAAEDKSASQELKRLWAEAQQQAHKRPGPGLEEEPVLLVAGDSGSGKTHLILEGGIEPELLSGNAYRGAPTASANIWRAQGVTLLEIGGEFSISSGIWHHLGALLSESRMRVQTRARPKARAVAWCLDSSLLLPTADPGALRVAADRAWRHCSELAAALDRTVPVYAIVTKLDRLPGFHEYVAPMDEMERAMPLGVTLPVDTAKRDRLSEAFEAISRFLRDQRVVLLGREPRIQQRWRLFEFPREFARLSAKLAEVGRLCETDPGRPGPVLRGVYFTGVSTGVQHPAPMLVQQATRFEAPAGATRIFGTADAQLLRDTITPQASPAVPSPIFVTGLFRDVVVKDLETRI